MGNRVTRLMILGIGCYLQRECILLITYVEKKGLTHCESLFLILAARWAAGW